MTIASCVRDHITPHRVVYELELPNRPSLLARARHLVRVVAGADATLNELAQQSREIHEKNLELESRVVALAAAEQELRERDAWLELALDAGRIGIWSVDVATGARRYSTGMFRLVGLDARTATTDDARALIFAEDIDGVDEAIRALVTSGTPVDLELRTRTVDGRTLWMRITGQRIESPAGTKLLGTATDITERRALDTQLRLADRLISAGTLAAGVAHEINTPLAYVMGNVELLQSNLASFGPARAQLEEPLGDMLDGVLRIREVVRDLRTLSRPKDDGVSHVALGKVVSAALRIVGHELRHRTRVVYTPPATDLSVLGNESRLGQVVTNLLLNAAQCPRVRSTRTS